MKETPNKTEISKQIKNAFDFVQKIYLESSYLVKEIEGRLNESEFNFQFLRTSGYSITARSSSGLEPQYVNFWLLRKFSFAFVEDSNTKFIKGVNVTDINDQLKVLYFRIVLDDKNQTEPQLIYGVLHGIEKYKEKVRKFESLMAAFEYADNKMFSTISKLDYKDGNFKVSGKLKKVNLLEINSSEDLLDKVITPAIKIYKSI